MPFFIDKNFDRLSPARIKIKDFVVHNFFDSKSHFIFDRMHIEILYSAFLRSSGINTDTRSLQSGQMFWALKGPNFNGNQFAAQALERGAAFVVIDEETGIKDPRIIRVEQGLRDLQKLAHHHRLVWGKHVIGVCGSNGKTTTKELISRVLGVRFTVFATPGNLNNHIGVPLCLLQLKEEHDLAVIEMGANHLGEIGDLCYLAEPNTGLITNIGKDHLEGFGTIEKTARANGELFDFLHQTLGTAFINTSDEWNLKLREKIKRQFSFPGPQDDAPCRLVPNGFFLSIQTPDSEPIETKLTGAYNFSNLAAALAVGSFYGVSQKEALQAVSTYEPGNNRSQVVVSAENTIISDAYNANPSSVLAALDNLKTVVAERKIAILGDMLELGKDSKKEHLELGKWASQNPDIEYWVTGPEMAAFSESCASAKWFGEKGALVKFIEENPPQKACILLKGSRGMKLETLLPYL